jgi:hypothetical protein
MTMVLPNLGILEEPGVTDKVGETSFALKAVSMTVQSSNLEAFCLVESPRRVT